MKMQKNKFIILLSLAYLITVMSNMVYAQTTTVTPVLTLNASGINDQDDMCVWIHPTDKSQSTIIASDKTAGKLFVYNLDGTVIQTIDVGGSPGPGNIDIRYNFMLSGTPTDIVAYNARNTETVEIYKVDPSDRKLYFISDFSASGMSGGIYGFCLYRSPFTGKYYAIGSSNSTQMRQWELKDNGNGGISGTLVRSWTNGIGDITEGLVADDETAKLYCANEGEGVYKYGAEPTDPTTPLNKVIVEGENGLTQDLEGITIYYAANGEGYIILSSQGNSTFKVYNRKEPHTFVKTIDVVNASSTDGIDVSNINFGSAFPSGIFLVHDGTGSGPYPIRVCMYEDLGLTIDTDYWDPRGEHGSLGLNDDNIDNLPKDYLLFQNYPNPFNPSTKISWYIPFSSWITLKVYDLLGNEVASIEDGYRPAGKYETDFNAEGLSSGFYFYILKSAIPSAGSGKFIIQSKKMILLK